ncbi:hypothetical protein QM565_19360 [Geitlerinema splendidum]|nr:hypothetical protein [Geitlerinema splendidum]
MELKKKNLAVRINSDIPTKTNVNVKGSTGEVTYTLLSMPFYLIGQIHRLLEEAL